MKRRGFSKMAMVEKWSGTMTIEVCLNFELAVFVKITYFPFPVCMGQKVGNFATFCSA
jgi:hypothetical protein